MQYSHHDYDRTSDKIKIEIVCLKEKRVYSLKMLMSKKDKERQWKCSRLEGALET